MVLAMLLCGVTSAPAQVSVGIGHPSVNIGINLPVYPQLVPVPSYPVYYAPRVGGNYFFYDGMYWVYERDNWYASSWYNGPWAAVGPEYVPAYVLRVPVRYYRQPPAYFRGWRADAPPRWGAHWGRDWEARRGGWDRWNRNAVPARAPLPLYQRQYAGDRYPRAVEQQYTLRIQNYRYQPRDVVVRGHFKEQVAKAPAAARETRQSQSAKESAERQARKEQKSQSAKESAERQARKEQKSQSAKESAERQARKEQKSQSAKESAPGQVKKEQGAKSAKEFAPGQVKKEEGAKSAKEFAPGQVKKEERAKSARESAPGQQRNEPREQGASGKSKDDGGGKGKGRGKDEERGRDRDK
jgi:hypothetical protein